MPSTPTTKSQVQAYQFVLRRMQSALVRKDAVMLHDPLRTHTRATIVGVILAVLGMLGFLIVGLFTRSNPPPDAGIVIGEQSGSIYVITGEPKKMIPTFNLASARLLLMAQQNGGGGGQFVKPEVVPDDQLKEIPRGRLHGIPNAPELLPSQDQLISTDWAVCDEIQVDESLPQGEQRQNATVQSTVFAGTSTGKIDMGTELSPKQALLVVGEDGKTYLVYRQGTSQNAPNANTVRAEVSMTDQSVTSALNLSVDMARGISNGLLNAIPSVGQLVAPSIPGFGEAPEGFDIDGLQVGEVFSVDRAAGTEFYVITRSGYQQISQAVADIIRAENSLSGEIPTVSPDALSAAPRVTSDSPNYLDVDHFPQQPPEVLDPLKNQSTCLGWSVKGEGPNEDAFTSVYMKGELPGPKDAQGNPDLIRIGKPGPGGIKVDNFYMPPGYAAAVRAATTKETFEQGPIQIISARGVRYGIPSAEIARGLLGHTELRPAPASIIGLLPIGDSLNTQDVMQTFDSLPVDPTAGTFEQPDDPAAATGGN